MAVKYILHQRQDNYEITNKDVLKVLEVQPIAFSVNLNYNMFSFIYTFSTFISHLMGTQK